MIDHKVDNALNDSRLPEQNSRAKERVAESEKGQCPGSKHTDQQRLLHGNMTISKIQTGNCTDQSIRRLLLLSFISRSDNMMTVYTVTDNWAGHHHATLCVLCASAGSLG